MADQVHILFTMRDDPDKVISYVGHLDVWVQSMLSTAHKVDQFQVMHNDTKAYIVRTRGDAIVSYDRIPSSLNLFIKNFRAFKGRKENVMAVSRNKKSEEKAAEQAQELTIEVTRVHDLTKDGQEGCNIACDLKINGVQIYGCFYREGKDKNGKDYSMVSFPSHKGNDGKYYNYAYVKLTDEDVEKISRDIEKML